MRPRPSLLRGLALLALVALSPHLPAAQQRGGPRVTAQFDTGLVKFGNSVRLLVQVEGAREAELKELPEVDGLRRVRASGPSISERMSFSGGRRSYSRSISWAIELRPERLGELVVPPLRLSVDGSDAWTPELSLSVVEDLEGKELGYVELVDPPIRVYEGEPFAIELLFGWDAALGAEINYLNLILPWWGQLSGTLEVDLGGGKGGPKRAAIRLNGRDQVLVEDLGQRDVRDRPFRVVRLRRDFVATRPGTLDLPTSYFEFGRVEETFLETRKKTYYVGRDPFSIDVLPLPDEGRPFNFSGAVGELGAVATPDRRDVEAGESIKLTVDWTGRANLEFFEPPDLGRLDAFDGFRVYGSTDRAVPGRRIVVYDLAPVSAEVDELPPVPLVVFDPEREQYRTVATRSIPIRVRALEGGSGLEGEAFGGGAALDVRDIQTADPDGSRGGRDARGPGARTVGGVALALFALWLGARSAVRRRGDPDAPAARRRRGARRALVRGLHGARSASAQEALLRGFVAARCGESLEAWEGRDPAHEWRALGLREEAAARGLSDVLGRLEAAHWAGDDAPLDEARLVEAADLALEGGL